MSLSTRDRFSAWQGVAGAGKTFAMQQLQTVARRQGMGIRGFAPSAEAAKVLQIESGIPSDTVASLLHSPPPLGGTQGHELWVVDEASLLSARQCADLMGRADAAAARVIFVGDTRQLSSVEAGNPFKLLQKHGITTAHLNESRRQKDASLKAAAAAMAGGDMTTGLDLLKSDTQEITREPNLLKAMARTYVALPPDQRSRALVLAGTNNTRETLTDLIRRKLLEHDSLRKEVTVTCLEAKDLTREETSAGISIDAGNILVIHREDRKVGIKSGDQVEVTHVDRLTRVIYGETSSRQRVVIPEKSQAGFTVYAVKYRSFGVGDKVRWTRNDRRLGLRNGQELTVVSLSAQDIVLQEQNGECHRLTKGSRHFLDHNYVNTVYSSQGKTCDRVLIAADRTFGKEAMYVAVTRAREKVSLFTPGLETTRQLAELSRAKPSASDLERVDSQETGRDQATGIHRQLSALQRIRGIGMS